jgi:hypothetical protein
LAQNDQDVEASTIMLKLWAIAYVAVVLICGGFATYVFLQMSSSSAMGQTSPAATGPTAAGTSVPQAAASTATENYSLPVPVVEVSKMYNAISQDETELRNVIVAIPILLTILLAFAPFALGNFVTVRVSEAVNARAVTAEQALEKQLRALMDARAAAADETLKRALEALAKGETAYEVVKKHVESRLRISEARISISIAYIYWSLGDSDQAALRAESTMDKSDEALELLKNQSQKDAAEIAKVERFRADAQDSWAYYVAELFVKRGEQKLDQEDYVKAKECAVEMLDR